MGAAQALCNLQTTIHPTKTILQLVSSCSSLSFTQVLQLRILLAEHRILMSLLFTLTAQEMRQIVLNLSKFKTTLC